MALVELYALTCNILAMAMEGNVSSIYKLEYENGIWLKKHFQEIPTKNALKWKFFAIDRNYYLAVANFGNGDREMSRIYKWNWKKRRFTNHQGQWIKILFLEYRT